MIWFLFAALSALSTSLVSILAKIGIKNINPLIAVTIQSCIMSGFLILLNIVTKNIHTIADVSFRSCHGWCIAGAGIMMGLATFFYFVAITYADVYRVTAIDRLSFGIVIVLSALLLGETLTIKTGIGVVLTFAGMMLIGIG